LIAREYSATGKANMPKRNQKKHPQHVIDEAVKRHLAGERASALAKEYGISKPGFYNWRTAYLEAVEEKNKRAGKSPRTIFADEIRQRDFEIEQLKRELAQYKNKLVECLVRHGEL
jgi:hypothetical protein